VIAAEQTVKQMSDKRKVLRLILGDQLNSCHSWFKTPDPEVTYTLMELRSETDYVTHHIQKITGFFAAMREFTDELRNKGIK
jgi:deoxyribodipyrimidine photolyase-related protein